MNRLSIILFLFIFSIMASCSKVKQKTRDNAYICQIGNAKTIQELIKQLNAWDKEALNAYENANDSGRNYVKDGETRGYVEAHKNCLSKLGVELIWNKKKVKYEIKEKNYSDK